MTITATDAVQISEPALTRPALRSGATIGCHSAVDFFSFMAVSLLPLLATRLQLNGAEKALLLGLGSVTSGLIQPVVAWLSDKFDSRAFGTAGFVVAVVCVSNIGRAESFGQLLFLHGLGAAGIGAFHPPAAAAVGQLSGAKRSIGVAVFFLAGMLGGVAGNITTPRIVDWFSASAQGGPDVVRGLHSLSWFMVPGLLLCVVLAIAIHGVPHRHHGAHDHHSSLSLAERRARWRAVGILYITAIIRFSVNMALVYLFAEWAEAYVLRREGAVVMTDELGVQASIINGPLQGMMQVGMGGMGLALGFFLRVRHEKLAFIGFPIFGAVAIAAIPHTAALGAGVTVPVTMAVGVLTGVGFGSVIPVSMSLAQRLLPHRTSLASGLMLGGAWAFAFAGPMIAQVLHSGLSDHELLHHVIAPEDMPAWMSGGLGLDAAFYGTALALLIAAGLGFLLPQKLILDTADRK